MRLTPRGHRVLLLAQITLGIVTLLMLLALAGGIEQ